MLFIGPEGDKDLFFVQGFAGVEQEEKEFHGACHSPMSDGNSVEDDGRLTQGLYLQAGSFLRTGTGDCPYGWVRRLCLMLLLAGFLRRQVIEPGNVRHALYGFE